jgi:hypothetical protein
MLQQATEWVAYAEEGRGKAFGFDAIRGRTSAAPWELAGVDGAVPACAGGGTTRGRFRSGTSREPSGVERRTPPGTGIVEPAEDEAAGAADGRGAAPGRGAMPWCTVVRVMSFESVV